MKSAREALRISPEQIAALQKSGLTEFARSIAGLEPFHRIKEKLILLPEGGGSSARYALAKFIERMLVDGMPADEIVSLAEAQIELNAYEAAQISPVQGIELDVRHDLAHGGYLAPMHGDSAEPILGHWAADEFHEYGWRGNSVALVLPIKVGPAIVDGDAPDDILHFHHDAQIARDNYRRILEFAISLHIPSPVSINSWCIITDRKSVFDSGRRAGTLLRQTKPIVIPINIDMLAVEDSISAIMRFPSEGIEKLNLALDRLVRSRAAASEADRALDLGVAQEIALMSADGDGKNEITSRIGLRCGWLLGSDVSTRQAYADQAAELYSLRSAVAHTGAISRKKGFQDIRNALDRADALVVKIIRTLLIRGSFPNWKELTFGGGASSVGKDYTFLDGALSGFL